MSIMKPLTVILLAGTLAACSTGPSYNLYADNPKTAAGTLLGAAGGGLLASQLIKNDHGDRRLFATALGTLAGAWLGNAIGQSLDAADRSYAMDSTQGALEHNRSGTPSYWRNPDSGNYGTATPVRTYNDGGRDCRAYETTIYVGGSPRTGRGTACRQPDGTWRITG